MQDRMPSEELRRLIKGKRKLGQTFAAIAQELGVAVSTVRYHARERRRWKRTPETPPERSQSTRRLVFAKALADGKTATTAALEAGSPNVRAARQFAQNAKTDPAFQDLFARILNEAGLDLPAMAAVIKEATRAEKVGGYAVEKESGKIKDKWMVPDYQVRHQAARTAFELHRKLGRVEEQQGNTAINFYLFSQDVKDFEELTGGPLPFPIKLLPEPDAQDQKRGPNDVRDVSASPVPEGSADPPVVGADCPQA